MLDIKLIREKPDFVRQRLAARGAGDEALVDKILQTDEQRRKLLAEVEGLKSERNRASKEIGALMGQKKTEEAEAKKKETRELGDRITLLDKQTAEVDAARDRLMLQLPNLPHESVPAGKSAEDNPVVRTHGEKPNFTFKPKSHVEICEALKLVDFARAAKLSGSGFLLYTNWGARLERALIQFLLELHTQEHGYTEVSPPFVVGPQCLEGVGQFPKFKDQYYGVVEGDKAEELGKLYLIPTAETPVANIHREEILKENQLPIHYCAYTPCFRGEAGAAGVGTRGMIRVHQFDKVELIKIVKPEHGYEEQEKMLANAERVLQLLGMHYRVVLLCTGDMGFASAKTYDIEVWAPGQGTYLEVSSVSNCEDFQARRMGLRFKSDAGENKFPHVLNGSGTALARLFVALIETCQQGGRRRFDSAGTSAIFEDRTDSSLTVRMKILLASSEVHPYSKTGGLADMVGALAKALARAGHQTGLVTPLYSGIKERFQLKPADWKLDLPLGSHHVHGGVWTLESEPGLTLYFIDQPGFYQRDSLYLQKDGISYPDNDERFIFFSKAVAHLARYLPWKPELIHAHDWQVGLVPLLVQHEKLAAGWGSPPPVCLTIHNLAYQGTFPKARYPLTNLPWDYFNTNGVEFYNQMNCLKAGIAYADLITTVSPRYAREITTVEYGCGLDGLLRHRQGDLAGILNGVDYDEWSTVQNPYLRHPYSTDDLSGKTTGKLDLQKELGLRVNGDAPLFGSVTRLADQKGVDIQLGALEEMLNASMQFVLLGSGSPAFENGYRDLARRHPSKVAIRIGFDQGLSHRIEAGCDFFLMPSRFEPCGLNQMYSLRYGTIPIVRQTGGLDDSVTDIAEDPDRANGIKFFEYSSRALAKGIRKALALYAEPELLQQYRVNGMSSDFSWEKTAGEYVKVYQRAING